MLGRLRVETVPDERLSMQLEDEDNVPKTLGLM